MPMNKFKPQWRVAGPPPLHLTSKQMDEYKLLTKFRDEAANQARQYKEWKANMHKYGIIERAHLRDEVFELFHQQLETSLREEGKATARHRAYLQAWRNLLNEENVIDISGIQYHLTRKINYAYGLHKETREELAKFEAKYDRKYELGSDRVDDLPPMPGERSFAEKAKRRRSSLMLGPNRPLRIVDHVALRQESKKYLNDLRMRVKKGIEEKFYNIQKKRAEVICLIEEQARKEEESRLKRLADRAFVGIHGPELVKEKEEKRLLEQQLKHDEENNLLLQNRLAEKRELEKILTLERDKMVLALMRQDYGDEVLCILVIWQRRKAEEERKRLLQEIADRDAAISQVFEIGVRAGDYKVNVGTYISKTEWREWTTLYVVDALPPLPSPFCVGCSDENDLLYGQIAAKRYFVEVEDWVSPKGMGPIGRNLYLGGVLHEIHLLACEPEDHQFMGLFRFSIMLAIAGPPYSGKTTVGKQLEADIGLVRIDANLVIQFAIEYALAEDAMLKRMMIRKPITPTPTPSENSCTCVEALLDPPLFPTPPTPTPPPTPPHSNPFHKFSWKGELGMRAKEALDNRTPIPDEVVAHLMLLVLQALQEYEEQVQTLECSTKLGAPKHALKKPRHLANKPMKDPKLAGFCFDGFPATPGQAAEFEKLITGYDYYFWKRFAAAASKLAPPPVPIPEHKSISGLDAIFILGSIAPEDALDRAMGKIRDPLTGDEYHLEMNPPNFLECKGLAMRVKSVNENPDYIYKRVKSAAMTWHAMIEYGLEWQNVFCIANSKMTVCPRHPATRGANCLVDVEEAKNMAERIFEGRLKSKDVSLLAESATKAKEAAETAAQEAEEARIKAEEAAKQHFNAQIAEVEAENLLDAIVGIVPVAKELVKETSLGVVAQSLEDAKSFVKQVQMASIKSEEATMEAQKAFDKAKEATEKAEAAIHCREVAWKAMEEALKSLEFAEEAKRKALEANEVAQTYLKPKPPPVEGEENVAPPIAPPAQIPPPPPPPPPPLEVVPPPIEGDPNGEEGQSDVDPEEQKRIIARTLFARWNVIEENYFEALPRAYQKIRRERTTTYDLMVKLRTDFLALLKLKSDCQEIFDEYQANYNKQEWSFFDNKSSQAALEKQAADVAEQLRSHCNERCQQAQEYLEQQLNEFRESRKGMFATLFTNFVQAELDRHIDSCSLIHGYLTKTSEEEPPFADAFRCNLSEILESPLVSFPIPFWMTTLEQPYPELYKVLCQAFLIANQLLDKIIGRESLGPSIIGPPAPPPERPSMRRTSLLGSTRGSTKGSIKGSAKGSIKGSAKGSIKGSTRGSTKGSNKGSIKGSIQGESVPKVEGPPPREDQGGLPQEPASMVWPIERMEVPMDPVVDPAIARDHQIFYYRLELIARNACINYEEIYPTITNTRKYLAAMIIDINKREMKVAEESIVYITDSAIERIPMWYKCFFAEENFLIAVPKLVKEPGSLVPMDALQWHVRLLYALGSKFKPAKAYIALDDAKIWVLQILEEIHELFKEDPAQRQQPRLPSNKDVPLGPFQRWVEKLDLVMQATLEDVDPPEGNLRLVIDWRLFLVALADTYFDYFLSKSTADDIMHARTDFFLVVATKSLTDPTDEFITLQDFLETWVWFDPVVVGDTETVVDSDEEAEAQASSEEAKPPATTEVEPKEAPWDFATEMKKFVFRLLDKGEVGLPWHSVLLFLCRDPDKETRIFKAFNVLGAPMGPKEVTLTPEEMLRLCYPNGEEGAELSGLKPWDIAFLKMILEELEMEKARLLQSPGDSTGSEPCLGDFPKPPPKKPWTGMECAEVQKPKLLSVCEFEEIMEEFLGQVPSPTPSYTPLSGVSSEGNRAIETFVGALGDKLGDPVKRFTFDDVLNRDATAKLRAALSKIYGRSCAYPTPLDVAVRPSLVKASIKK